VPAEKNKWLCIYILLIIEQVEIGQEENGQDYSLDHKSNALACSVW